MIFDGENIILNLRVIDLESDELVFSDYFGSIEDLNRYLENPSIKEPICPEITIDVCPIKKDIEITLLFSFEIMSLCPLDEDEIEEFYDVLKECSKPVVANLLPEMKAPSKCEEVEAEFEKLPLSTFKYLCPHCWNEPESCSCVQYPFFLVQIDAGIVDIVRELNLKGYFTAATCEGHPENKLPYFYINFKEVYGFDSPDGFYWDRNNLRCEYKGDTLEDLVQDKKDKLERFLNIVNALPSLL